MIPALLITLPLAAGLLSFWWRADGGRRSLFVATAIVHCGLTVMAWMQWNEEYNGVSPHIPPPGAWVAIDATGLLFLTTISVLFLGCAIYSVGYLARKTSYARRL